MSVHASSWTAQATVTASLTAFLYEGFTYNAVFLGRILPAVGRENQVTPLLVVFNVIWGLALWSYLRVSWADPGAVPEEWHEFVRRVGVALPIAPGMKEWQPGKATMCRHCTRARPERSHHCALCGVCILRLDHHCPWINNCVGFNNHKYFLLTCFYALLACVVSFVTAVPELVIVTQRLRLAVHGAVGVRESELEPSDEIAFVVFGALAIFISMFLTPLLYFQMKLAINNRTTIEDNYNNMTNPFDQGTAFSNLAQIFGKLGPDWPLPIKPWRPFLDGVSFPSSAERQAFDERPLTAMNGTMTDEDQTRENDDRAALRPNDFEGIRGKNWARAYADGHSKLTGEALWRAHYHIIEQSYNPAEMRKPSTLDYMLGCMQIDCEGNQRAVPV
jgi:palmitoyltransferase